MMKALMTRNKRQRLVKKHGKAKALTILAHKISRAVYYMLKRKTEGATPLLSPDVLKQWDLLAIEPL